MKLGRLAAAIEGKDAFRSGIFINEQVIKLLEIELFAELVAVSNGAEQALTAQILKGIAPPQL